MSNATAAVAPTTEGAAAKPKSKKMLIIIAAVVLLAGGGAGAYFMMQKPQAEEAKAAADKLLHKKMVYLPMDTYTVNLRDADQERFLQVTINLELADNLVAEALKQQMPSVRNRVLLLLSSKTSTDLQPREGKEKLANEIAEELRKPLEGTTPTKGVEHVLFSHLVIQ